MELLISFVSIFLSLFLGVILTDYLKISIQDFSRLSFVAVLGIITYTAISYFFSLIFGFPAGVVAADITAIFIIAAHYNNFKKYYWDFVKAVKGLISEKYLLALLIIAGFILAILFNNLVINPIKGDLYVSGSTYGDLTYHLTTISQIAYGLDFPPDNPFYAGKKLVYPFLSNFFSAILVYKGMSLRDSIIIPGLILSLSFIVLIYDLGFILLKSRFKSFLAAIFYLFGGGLGFYFFFRDYSFNPSSIFTALMSPGSLIEYSHIAAENIQWPSFLSRMLIPERSIIFGFPIGLIILRLLYFREHSTAITKFEIVFAAFMLSLMPLLHTHTLLVFAIVLPLLSLATLDRKEWKKQLQNYSIIILLAVIFVLPHVNLFMSAVNGSEGFFRYHYGWMKQLDESILWFWFKNTYLYIPLALLVLLFKQSSSYGTRIITIAGLMLMVSINFVLFSPFDWDNVKFLLWAGLFFSFSASSFLVWIYNKKSIILKVLAIFVSITMVSTALLSIYRETNLRYVLFTKEAVAAAEYIKEKTPKDALFLTYKIHNSPVNNLAGRSIMMGYPGYLWVHGIDYAKREKDIALIYSGAANAGELIKKYGISYVVIENYDPSDMLINRNYFDDNHPVFYKSLNYTIYKVN